MFVKIAIILLIIQNIDAAKNKSCHDLLRELADTESKFAHCATTNSVPVTMCTICKEKYSTLKQSYNVLKNDTVCGSTYFDKDRVNLVASTEAALSGLWTKAYCDDCTKNNTEEFHQKSTDLYDCIEIYKNESCKKCMNIYLSLNTFYITLDEHNNGKVCFDIQDSMNRTRNKWSTELKCCRREFRMTLFAVALCIVTTLPFLFYGGTYLVTKRQERSHGILNDEDPLLSSSTPSSSNAAINPNMQSEEVASTSAQRMNRQSQPPKGFTTLDEESDEDNLATNSKLQ